MPQTEHLSGVGAKERRMNQHIKESAKKEWRYGKRAEVAARTVLKHHKEEGHRKGR